jgi:hypothetical protein
MSKNSLEIRQKYVAKLLKKVDSLTESVNLLAGVDNKIFTKQIQKGGAYLQQLQSRQRGGADSPKAGETGVSGSVAGETGVGAAGLAAAAANMASNKVPIDLKEMQKNVLVTKYKLQKQNEAIELARSTISKLNSNLGEVKDAIKELNELMRGLNFDFEPLDEPPEVDLTSYKTTILFNAYKDISWAEMIELPKGEGIPTELDGLLRLTITDSYRKNKATKLDPEIKEYGMPKADYDKLEAKSKARVDANLLKQLDYENLVIEIHCRKYKDKIKYDVGDLVSDNGKVWRSKVSKSGSAPNETNPDWAVVKLSNGQDAAPPAEYVPPESKILDFNQPGSAPSRSASQGGEEGPLKTSLNRPSFRSLSSKPGSIPTDKSPRPGSAKTGSPGESATSPGPGSGMLGGGMFSETSMGSATSY